MVIQFVDCCVVGQMDATTAMDRLRWVRLWHLLHWIRQLRFCQWFRYPSLH
ncbi:hypothetical protein HanRHA438_Chr03g0099731 [Helianthus annuus]|uniref:Uncharacterized protein n=1 Tax=Helianthus annuus TaxID=4232 RepID=A0A251V448_HELAN|nr:hypothetical protein HanXRQr2_Chr03g0088561 [Helianthus annuus]KAJ0495784.1 hypothetical protein HanIR_Chr12g0612791 [Helianthus annuus]KAJ0591553.1 hypothetical protein HanHA300_Chr03g0074561 [Helianthus annuus]KAJ0606444.1 hypothetical protein HanHA89_Chr03g0085171 [Helianthus annuus]KAJ0772436.1 hypothetical protein HanOQP8_Chr03g0087291 [Helianthus annuus]